uniref:Peptidase S1 domain-containing protein n=1 Tax=Timema cristinae TaxID=61476 RepID=A0A7R9CHV1_TIMCR|nr:unnamed protein product [Timema cristinae]
MKCDKGITKWWNERSIGRITEIEDLAVRSGTIVKGTNGTVHHVQRVIVHHNFNSRNFLDNDIALIQVVEPFSKNKYVKYVELPDQGEITPVGTKAWVAGWGMTEPDMKGRTSLLKHANVNVLEKERCEDNPMLTGMYAITSGMICAENKGRSSYKGDSGGPLVVKMGKKVKQIGVVSWGDYTGKLAFPGIYTNVSQYRLWIHLKSNI